MNNIDNTILPKNVFIFFIISLDTKYSIHYVTYNKQTNKQGLLKNIRGKGMKKVKFRAFDKYYRAKTGKSVEFNINQKYQTQDWLLKTSGKDYLVDFARVFGVWPQQIYQATRGLQKGLLLKMINHALKIQSKKNECELHMITKHGLSEFLEKEVFTKED